ncbi:MAG: type 1 glutamine amidotransferase [Pseudomonadales bacterium]|nr:type 1 glutamine amidotransferase [Pseudomonadales bacterium]NRA14665.1 type 1 glutamine amidotransferase [Oceanospirillaceae bacterium]
MKIGILQTGHVVEPLRSKHGNFNTMFEKLLAAEDFEFVSYPVIDGHFPASAETADGWLITGSASSSYEQLDWIVELEDFIRSVYARSIPIVGICFGHQILAQALGGKVEKFTGGWSIGNQQYQLHNSAENPRIVAWHQDQVTQLPEDAQCIGSSDFCENAFLLYGKKAYSVQAHPEFSVEFAKDLMALRRENLPAELVQAAAANFDADLDTAAMAETIARFFKTGRRE